MLSVIEKRSPNWLANWAGFEWLIFLLALVAPFAILYTDRNFMHTSWKAAASIGAVNASVFLIGAFVTVILGILPLSLAFLTVIALDAVPLAFYLLSD